MPTPSYLIMDEIKPMRKQYQEEGLYEESMVTDLIDDHVDALKSQYYNAEEYYEKVVERINSLLSMDSFSEPAREVMNRILNDIVLPHQARFLDQKKEWLANQ
ncbi:MAG: hypothetical protein H9W81_08420 [Enterococcus sp.]|nr:hypothetical protein [Enterococcus sp.]